MILYYTGTGNSRYAAERISAETGDQCENLFERIRTGDCSPIESDRPFVIVTPTYAWRIPHILRDWLQKAQLTGSREIYFVMTCGDEIGNAAHHLARLCRHKHMYFKGCAQIVMPENYVALFDVPDGQEALEIVERAEPEIDKTAGLIAAGEDLPEVPAGAGDRMKSSIVNAAFYPMFVHAGRFRVLNTCTGCGKCIESCVLDNIFMDEGKPRWNNRCTHCMACICGCPEGAIEYGRATEKRPRYRCPK